MSNISMQQYRFPSSDDYSGAITALWRLQDTYKLEPTTIASGKLGSTTSVPMSGEGGCVCVCVGQADDCCCQVREGVCVCGTG